MQELIVELRWSFLSHLVWKLSSLRLDNIGLTWGNAVCLRVFALSDSVLDSFLVVPGRVFVLDKSPCWRLVLPLRTRQVVPIKESLGSRESAYDICTLSSGSSVDHFVHEGFKLILNFFGLLLEMPVSNFSLAPIISHNVSDLSDVLLSSWRHVNWLRNIPIDFIKSMSIGWKPFDSSRVEQIHLPCFYCIFPELARGSGRVYHIDSCINIHGSSDSPVELRVVRPINHVP